jgi:quercetin dioxygenase-like cupin family protein
MDGSNPEVVEKPFQTPVSRRTTLRGIGAGGLAALVLAGGLDRSADAQSATPTPSPTYAPGVYAEILGHKVALAASGYNLQLTRITFDPGAGVPPHTHPGDTVTYQLYGSHVYTVIAGSALIVRAGTAPASGPEGEAMTVGQPYTIMPGDVLLFDANTAHTAHNPGTLPAVLMEAQMRAVGEPMTMPLTMPMGTATP